MSFSLMTGVGVNFKPWDSKVVCSFVSGVSDRFLICCLNDSMLF